VTGGERAAAERWASVERLLDLALDLAPAERPAFVARETAHDPVLRAELETLLARCDDAGGFLDEPAAEFAAPLLAASLAGPDAAEGEGGRRRRPAPAQVGPYRVLRELGRGGMGVVYLAERDDPELPQQVALKVLPAEASVAAAARRFREERRILASLDHPNVARLLDGGVAPDGTPWFSMELVDGLPIDLWCDAQGLDVEARLRLFLDVCAAVQYAHQHLVVHRDLKPSNILVRADGTPKLLDFGIAKLLAPDAASSDDGRITRTGMRVLTPAYASPEQVRGEPVSTASDVYALGVLLYELLAGRGPYGDDVVGQRDLERRVVEHEPARPSAVAGDERRRRRLRGELDAIVLTALRKEPARRYASAERLADDVRRHLAGLPVAARADSRRYRLRKFVARHRWAVAAAAIALLLVAAFAVAMAVQRARIARERARAERTAAFLVELFTGANPEVARGREVTAHALLARGAVRLERDLALEPQTRAAMLDAIGRAYFGLGEYDAARPLLEEALAMRRRLHAGDHPDVAASLYALAYLLRNQSDFDRAEPLYRESLAMRRRLLPADHPDVVTSLNGLAYLLRGRERWDAALPLYREAIARGRRVAARGAGPGPELAQSVYGLGATLQGRGDLVAAERAYREALALFESLDGEHPGINTALFGIAATLHERGEHAAAESAYRASLAAGQRILGARHPVVTTDMASLATLLADRGELAEAERLYREALAIQRASLPAVNERTARTLVGLGRTLARTGRAREAEPLLREALAMRRATLAPTHWQIAVAEGALGTALSHLGRAREAESLLVASHAALVARQGPAHPATRRAGRELAEHRARHPAPDRMRASPR
jgi:serine/threonine-protein kinase